MAPLDAGHREGFGALMAEHLAGGGMVLAAVHDPLPCRAGSWRSGDEGVPDPAAARTGPGLGQGRRAAAGPGLLRLRRHPAAAGGRAARPSGWRALAPGIAWLALALAALLSLERLFERDFEDGALDLLALGPAPLEAVAVAKCLAHWLAAGAPLALAAPIAALALGASPHIIPLLIPCALAGGLAFSFLGGLGAAWPWAASAAACWWR
jgi:hypothetical protein